MNLTFFKLSPSFILCWHISKLAKFLLRPRWGIQNWRERTQTGAWLHRLLEESWRRMLLVGWPTSPLPTAQTHVYSRSLSQNIPQSKSPGYLPLGRLRTRACSQDSLGPIPLFQQWLHRCQGCWKWELHPPPWSPAFRHHPWLGDDVWRGVRTSYWTVSGRKHWEEKPLPLPVCSLSASHLCLVMSSRFPAPAIPPACCPASQTWWTLSPLDLSAQMCSLFYELPWSEYFYDRNRKRTNTKTKNKQTITLDLIRFLTLWIHFSFSYLLLIHSFDHLFKEHPKGNHDNTCHFQIEVLKHQSPLFLSFSLPCCSGLLLLEHWPSCSFHLTSLDCPVAVTPGISCSSSWGEFSLTMNQVNGQNL